MPILIVAQEEVKVNPIRNFVLPLGEDDISNGARMIKIEKGGRLI